MTVARLPSRSPAVGAQIMGTQKGGTTALFHFLSEHDEICTPRGLKEAHFFDNDAMFAAGSPDYDGYESLFPGNSRTVVRLEATPVYMYWRPVAARLAAYNPASKLIMILRDPVQRAVSQWEMEFSRGAEADALDLALERELETLHGGEQDRIRSYIDRGLYGAQIRRLLGYFPREQMLFLRQEDLLSEHRHSLRRVYEFLRVEEPRSFPAPRMIRPLDKTAAPPAVIRADIRETLRRLFLADLQDVGRITGLDVGAWGSG